MNALGRLTRLSGPLVFGQLAFAVNGFVTQYFLARFSGDAFHAALPGSMLAVAVSSLFISTLGYTGTVLAKYHGAGDLAASEIVFRRALKLTALSIPLFLLAIPLGHAVLAVFDTQSAVLEAEFAYYDILLVNGFFTTLAAVLGGFFTGRGKTRFVGAMTVAGFVLNMALAPLFIGGFRGFPWNGVVGAGWAATLAHIMPCMGLGWAIWCHSRSVPSTPPCRHTVPSCGELLRVGLPNGIRAVVDIGGFFAFVAVLAECPQAAVAASSAAFAVNGVYQAFPQAVSAALEIVTARDGTDHRRSRRAFHVASIQLAVGSALAFAGFLLFFGRRTLGVFRPDQLADVGGFDGEIPRLIAILAVKGVFESVCLVYQGRLRGEGRTTAAFAVQTGCSLLFWLPLFLSVRVLHPSVTNYWLTMLAASVLTAAVSHLVLRSR